MMDDARTTEAEPEDRAGGGAERVIVFARYPEPGRTKTRLIPELGAEGAAELQRRMTEATLQTVRGLRDRRGVEIEVRCAGSDPGAMAELFGGDLRYREQAGEELGQRMHGAFVDAFEERGSRVVMIGSDCPGLTADRLGEALDALRRQDMVLGPASDGGYYLIGLSRPEPGLFEGIAWGGERVLTQTLSQADGLGLSVHRLGVLSDVDRPEDLYVWRRMETGEQRNAEGDS